MAAASASLLLAPLLAFAAPQHDDSAPAPAAVDFGLLLRESWDLARLARRAEPPYRIVQFSSYDRRSREPDGPGWFSNADGFGGEEIPGFEAVLREPDARGIGDYLICEVDGPGAIVRGWSAGMGGTLRVWLDDAAQPLWQGDAYSFLARRSEVWLREAGLDLAAGDAFVQQDADYLPVPFARRLRVSWEGRLADLHFYHLEVRRYPAGTAVRSFDFDQFRTAADDLRSAAEALVAGATGPPPGAPAELAPPPPGLQAFGRLDPGAAEHHELAPGPAAVTLLELRLAAADPAAAFRGVVLGLDFDHGAATSELPVGDFFGSFPGLQPYSSLPLAVLPDGTLRCRFVMPYRSHGRIGLRNASGAPVRYELRVETAPWLWGERSLRFRATWRAGRGLVLGERRAIDLDFLRVRGAGRVVGVASLIVNPSRIPTPWGSWWGEGDEKIFLDDERFPAFFGTGSEDYYNYSWSRPDLFEHPYCGQPVDSGPANAGYVVNYRFHVLDDLPFERLADFRMELWPHRQDFPIDYARVAWWYAADGAVEDAPPPAPEDLCVPPLPRWEPDPAYSAAGSRMARFEELLAGAEGVAAADEPLASAGRVAEWSSAPGARVSMPLAAEAAGDYQLHVVARHVPDGGALRVLVDGRPLVLDGAGGSELARIGEEVVPLRTRHGTRILNLDFAPIPLEAGTHELTIERVAAGPLGFDYLWWKKLRDKPGFLPGAIEAEGIAEVGGDAGGGWEVQDLGAGWSGGAHLWVRATAPGQFVELLFPVAEPGLRRVRAKLTRSWDYGIVDLYLDGRKVAEGVDLWAASVTAMDPIDLGEHDLGATTRLRIVVTGTNPASAAPHHYLALDCLLIDHF